MRYIALICALLSSTAGFADAAGGRTPLVKRIAKLAPKRGMRSLLRMPSFVFGVPPTTISVDHKGKLWTKRGYGEQTKAELSSVLALLTPGALGRALEQHGVADGKQIERQHRQAQLHGTLSALGVTLSDPAKVDRLLDRGVRLAKKRSGAGRSARISVGQTVRETPYEVLELSPSGQLVTYGIKDMQVGESKSGTPRVIDIAEAKRRFPDADLKGKLESL